MTELKKLTKVNTKKVVPLTEECRAWFMSQLGVLKPLTEKIIASGDDHVPALFVYSKELVDGREQCAIMPVTQFGEFGDADSKNHVANMQRYFAEQGFTRACIFLVETWLLKQDNPGKVKEFPKGSIAEHPDREEAMMYNLLYHDDEDNLQQMLAMYPIKRPENVLGEPVFIDPQGTSFMSGRFVAENDESPH